MGHKRRMSLRLPLRLAGVQILACIGVVVLRVIYVYGATFWQNATAINFIAVWIPAAIGISPILPTIASAW